MMSSSVQLCIRRALVVGLAFLAMALGNTTSTQAQTIIADFGSVGTHDYSYTAGATSSLDTYNGTSNGSIGGSVSFATSFYTPGGTYNATIDLAASTTTAASGANQSGFSGTLSIDNNSGSPVGGVANGSPFLTISFTDATLTSNGGGSYTFGGSATITAYLGNSIGQPETFSLSLSGGPSAGGFGSSFKANDDGNASATLSTTPEPSAMALAGLGSLGFVVYGLRRRKAMGA